MPEIDAASSPLSTASAPLWTLEGLRGADPVLGIALLMILAVVVGEAVQIGRAHV